MAVSKIDPNKVAYYEKTGWQAYYAHQWGLAFRLMVQLNREEFHMSFLNSVLAALDIVRASIAFAPLENNDVSKAKHFIERFYEKARRSANIEADAKTLTDLEIDYWIVHRNLAVERKQNPQLNNASPMVESLERLHRALFSASPEAIRRSAEERAKAAVVVDKITGRYSKDVEADWRAVEEHLQKAYSAVA